MSNADDSFRSNGGINELWGPEQSRVARSRSAGLSCLCLFAGVRQGGLVVESLDARPTDEPCIRACFLGLVSSL